MGSVGGHSDLCISLSFFLACLLTSLLKTETR